MPKRWIIITDDAANVTVSGGEELSSDVAAIAADAAYRAAKEERYRNGRQAVVDGIAAVNAEITAWTGYDNAMIKASLGNVVLPELRRVMRGLVWLGDLVVGVNSDAGPS